MNYWTEDRKKIHFWIANDLDLPVFADAYKGAVICLSQGTPGYVTFVCHTCRDIMNEMASAFSGIKGGRVNYQHLVDNVKKKWNPKWAVKNTLLSNSDPATPEPEVNVSRDFCITVDKLLDEHNKGRMRAGNKGADFFSTFLEYNDKDRIPGHIIRGWIDAKKCFMRTTHLSKKPFNESIHSELKNYFSDLEQTLLTAADSARNRLKAIDEILAETNV